MTPPPRAVTNAPVVFECTTATYVTRPPSLTLGCANGGVVATSLRWSSWAAQQAVATGAVAVDNCQPTCATGRTADYPVVLTLGGPEQRAGRTEYTSGSLVFAGERPAGWPSTTDVSLTTG